MTMIRKQFFITAEQDRLLKRRASATGRPEVEVIRAAIDRELGTGAEPGDWKRRIMAFAGAIPDVEALESTVAKNRARWRRRLDRSSRRTPDR